MKKILSTCLHAIIFGIFLAGTISVMVFAQGNDVPKFQQIMTSLFSEQQNGSWTLKSNSVNSDTIADGQIQTDDIADGAVTMSKLSGSEGLPELNIAGNATISGDVMGGSYDYVDYKNATPQSGAPTITGDYSYKKCAQVVAEGDTNAKWGYATVDLADICADNDGCGIRIVLEHIRNYLGEGVRTLEGSFAIGPEVARGGTIQRHAFFRQAGSDTGFWLGDNSIHAVSLWNWTYLQDFPRTGTNYEQNTSTPFASNTTMTVLSHPHVRSTWTFCD